jgi:uncharacterized protein YndB with AHSA1/START domain
MTTQRVSRIVRASRKAIYRALTDPEALAQWRVPDDMIAQVHEFDLRPGGWYRMSLTYFDDARRGKTSGSTDTFRGTFAELAPDERVVELIDFESADSAFCGTIRVTISLADADGGTKVTMAFENLPAGIRPEDNELGCQMSLAKLAQLVEW